MFPHLLAPKVALAAPKHPLQTKDPHTLTRDDCKLWQELGLEGYPAECKVLLDSASKTGLLARRKSSVARTWNEKDGHGKRGVVGENPADVGVTHDAPKDGKSVDELILASKSAAEVEKIAELKMRTLSRGGKIDTKHVETELKRRNSAGQVPAQSKSS